MQKEVKTINVWQCALNEGIKQGIQQGMQQGREKWMKQGIQQGMQQGREKWMKQGIEKGTKQGHNEGVVDGYIEVLLKLGLDENRILEMVMESKEADSVDADYVRQRMKLKVGHRK